MGSATGASGIATMADVATLAGVSTATVSRTLRGHPHVSDEVAARVRDAVDQLSYVVSPAASRLATGRTGAVAVLVPFPSRWFFGQVLSGAESILRERHLDLLLYDLGTIESRRRFFEQLPVRRRVDAVLSISLPVTARQRASLLSLDQPVVLVGERRPGMSSVRIDDERAARDAVRHLIQLGHKRIGMIQTADGGTAFHAAGDRRRGYRSELAAHGLTVRNDLQAGVEFGLAGGEKALDQLLAVRNRPTAVFAETDELAYGAIAALRRRGLSMPDDMALVGIDDHDMSALLDLTTIRQGVVAQGVRAAELLVEALENGTGPTDVLMPTELVLRGSTVGSGSRASSNAALVSS